MKFPFYNNDEKAYTIDDANYDCERIIVADCNMNHRYATLCELIQDCPSVKQLTNSCIVNFLNNPTADTKGLSADKWFVKVNSNGCLEIADPCICDNGDRYVAATREDNDPGPLDRKVKGSCSYDGLYCIDIEEAGPKTLVWRPSGPNGPFINPALPTDTCADGQGYIVKLKHDGSKRYTDFDCPEEDDKPQYCKCAWVQGISYTPCCFLGEDRKRGGRTVRYFLPWFAAENKPVDSGADSAESFIQGDWVCQGTDAFKAPSRNSNAVIVIDKPGIYQISFSTYVTFYQTLHSIRCGLYYKNYLGEGPYELGDIKYETGEYYVEESGGVSIATFNRNWPEEWDKDKFIENGRGRYKGAGWTMENTGLPFSRSYTINVQNTPVEIFMVVKPDMRGTDPRLILENDSIERYNISVEGTGSTASGCATTIELVRIGNSVHQSRYKQIRYDD